MWFVSKQKTDLHVHFFEYFLFIDAQLVWKGCEAGKRLGYKGEGVHGEGTSGDEIKVGVRYAGGRGREGRGSWLELATDGRGEERWTRMRIESHRGTHVTFF